MQRTSRRPHPTDIGFHPVVLQKPSAGASRSPGAYRISWNLPFDMEVLRSEEAFKHILQCSVSRGVFIRQEDFLGVSGASCRECEFVRNAKGACTSAERFAPFLFRVRHNNKSVVDFSEMETRLYCVNMYLACSTLYCSVFAVVPVF
ncbi:uncharacterized protein LOC144246241 isoform X1 [Lonchura striata]